MRRFFARVTVPDEGSSSPMRIRNRVVLPIPLGPTSASRAPFATENVTLEKMSSAPKDLERELTVISDIVSSNLYCVLRNRAPNYKAGEKPPLRKLTFLLHLLFSGFKFILDN